MKKIKTLFYCLFAADIAAGIAVSLIKNAAAGIITAAVLLVINISVYAVFLKMEKINGQTRTDKKSKTL